ncbi:NUDIX hydrolase [Paenibacillus humicola]|uniref:NUDIX hydrolase n=1 Tax=Paenibacillus humicola TaxID=3110540 RepID=UPI00237B75D5|nr:NUDIX domain-containing protein [Paenibacillus humicola]
MSAAPGNGAGREEHFDIYDEAGRRIGDAPRSEVHARGYWHRSFHCWLIRRDGDRRLVLFQLRHKDKDTFPDHFDITAAGHLAAGETVRDASRELEEELGIAADFDLLIPLGETRMVKSGEARGVPFVDSEISDVFGLIYNGPLRGLNLQADEVAGVYEAELEAMIGLFERTVDAIDAAGVEPAPDGTLRETVREVRADRFVPRDAGYYAKLFRTLLTHL